MNSNKRISLLLGFSLLLTWTRALAALSGAPPEQKHAEVQEVTSAISTDTTAQTDGIYACSPDGKCFIFASQDSRLRYCRADDGTVLHTFHHCSAAFTGDGPMVIAVLRTLLKRKRKDQNYESKTLPCPNNLPDEDSRAFKNCLRHLAAVGAIDAARHGASPIQLLDR